MTTAYNRSVRDDHFPVDFLIKYNENGDTLWTKYYVNKEQLEEDCNIVEIDDTLSILMALKTYDRYSYEFDLKFYLIDSSGNILDTNLFSDGISITSNSIKKTFDNKFIIGGTRELTGTSDMYMLKINKKLQADTFYPGTRNYDTLCPYQIKNSTITFDSAIFIPLELDSLLSKIDPLVPTDNKINIYPNPFENYISIEAGNQTCQVRIFDLAGKLLLNQKVTCTNPINTEKLLPGIYFIEIRDENGNQISVQKISKLY